LDGNYKDIVLDLLWKKADEGVVAGELYSHVKKRLGGKGVSRTAILLYLDELCKENILHHREETCRGGRRKRYFPRKNREEYHKDLVREAILELIRTQPRYTLEAFFEILNSERLNLDVHRNLLSFFMNRDELTYSALEQAMYGLGNPVGP